MLAAKITRPGAGWPYDQEQIQKLLDQCADKLIPVKRIDIGRSSTDIILYDNPKQYNSVNFSFYLYENQEWKEIDIFKTKHPKINHTYMCF
ncbi:hypothetical protein NCTGTJJY_CDS0153 [Serratia phage 92A1]|nr:hypothetical protein NCTGTJJY_CDS0153 [Serratia phage 92A1]